MDKIRDVAVIVGSLRKDSINRKVANALAELAPAGLKLTIIEIGHLPIYNQDGDENPPAAWTEFRERTRAADGRFWRKADVHTETEHLSSRPTWNE
jgi:chromate reductase